MIKKITTENNDVTIIEEPVYSPMPQNDKIQIDQIVQEYEGARDNGLVHGLQKDAIQNAFGARLVKKESSACRDSWKCTFELIKIKGEYALVFWDEGTTGLTGNILTAAEIDERSNKGELGSNHADQRLSRFLTRFESGGNLGPGSFGRGKLIFQGASNTYSILIDSLRSDDNKYIFLKRKIIGNSLQQYNMPLIDDEAKKYLKEETGNVLKPLLNSGTRITILNIKDEIIEAFKNSFSSDASIGGYSNIFSKMIEETWWELIQFGANIKLIYGSKELNVGLTEPLKSLLNNKNNEKNYHVYSKDNISVIIDNYNYKIKHLRFVVTPDPLSEELRGEIWVQRKRMKIGEISRGLSIHHKIVKNITGYLILDSELETEFEKKEWTTHYGFQKKGRVITQVRDIIRSHLEVFQQEIGLNVQTEQAKARKDMLEALRELNEQAAKLGLPTDFSTGIQEKDIDLIIKKFVLPRSSNRVEINEIIGPIEYCISNNSSNMQPVKFVVTAEQRNKADIIIYEKEKDIVGKSKDIVSIKIKLDKNIYSNAEGLLIRARVLNKSSNDLITQVSRILWIGMDEPSKPKENIIITPYTPIFPRTNSRRVEIGEVVRNIKVKISNNTAESIKINFDVIVRKAKSQTQDVRNILDLIKERSLILSPFSDVELGPREFQVSEELFGSIFEEQMSSVERKCELFYSARSAENYPMLRINRGQHIGQKKIISFYCGIDPSGLSVFKNLDEKDYPEEGWRSKIEGDRASGGYTFILNVGHASYKLANQIADEARKNYIKEQMFFQAYLIAINEKVFKGPAENFKDILEDDYIEPTDAARYIDEIVGIALNESS